MALAPPAQPAICFQPRLPFLPLSSDARPMPSRERAAWSAPCLNSRSPRSLRTVSTTLAMSAEEPPDRVGDLGGQVLVAVAQVLDGALGYGLHHQGLDGIV